MVVRNIGILLHIIRHNPEDRDLNLHRRENLRFRTSFYFLNSSPTVRKKVQ